MKNKLNFNLFKKNKNIIWNRSLKILPYMLGLTLIVHNGNKYLPIYLNKYMIGHKLGEFSITLKFKRFYRIYKKNK